MAVHGCDNNERKVRFLSGLCRGFAAALDQISIIGSGAGPMVDVGCRLRPTGRRPILRPCLTIVSRWGGPSWPFSRAACA